MKILVTGSSGFIGNAVCFELIKQGYTPVAFDTPRDVRDFDDIASAAANVDGIINLAGILGTSETVGAEILSAQVNIVGGINVMDVAETYSIPLVQIATGHEGQPNPYAITKKCITDLCLSRAQWKGQEITVVRAYHVYGPGQKMCAPHGRSTVRKIIPSFVARALTGMPIQVNGDGLQKIDLVYLDDVAKVLVDAIKGPYGQIVEAGTGTSTAVIDAACMVIASCHSESKIEHLPMRIGEPIGTTVVAIAAKCPNPWPYKLGATIDWYKEKLC